MIIFNAISFYLRWRFVNKLLTDVCRGKRINIISTAQKWDNNFSEQQIHLAKTVRTVWSAGSAFLSFFFFTIHHRYSHATRSRYARCVAFWERYGNRRWTSTTGDSNRFFFSSIPCCVRTIIMVFSSAGVTSVRWRQFASLHWSRIT